MVLEWRIGREMKSVYKRFQLTSATLAFRTFNTCDCEELVMPRGDKSTYTDKQKRKAEHIEEGYEKRGIPEKEAERRAWATVNAGDHGGKKPGGSGRGKEPNRAPSRSGGKKGGAASAARTKAQKSASAKKAARTRKSRAAHKKKG